MVQTIKTLIPSTTEANVEPADMLRQVFIAANATRTAALSLVCNLVGFMFLVNHFVDKDDEKFQSRADVIPYLREQIAEQTNVKGGMLDIYLTRADTLYGKMISSLKIFSPIIQEVGQASKANEIGTIIGGWLEKNWKIDSLAALSEQLGYATGAVKPEAPAVLTPAKAVERVTNTMRVVEKLVTDGGMKESEVAKTIVNEAANPVVFARAAITRITEKDDLTALVVFIEKHIVTLAKLAEKAQISVKAKVKGKGKAEPTGTTAHATA